MSRVSIMLSGQDVTPHMVRDDFPEWIETSVKGAGWFDWTVKPFTFRLHQGAPVVPAYGQACRITLDGVERFAGVVDGIKDAFSKVPELTIQPPAVTLKDVMAGDQGQGSDGHQRWVFEIRPEEALGVRDAILAALSRYNENRDPRIEPVGDWSVTVEGGQEDPVITLAPHGLTGPESYVPYYEPSIPPNPTPFGSETIVVPLDVQRAQWVGTRISPAGHIVLGLLDVAWEVNTDAGTVTAVPRIHAVRLPNGGPPSSNVMPLNHGYSLEEWESWPAAQLISARLTESAMTSYVREQAGLSDDAPLSIYGAVDLPDGTWAVVRMIAPGGGDLLDRTFLTWWGNPLIQRISGRWENTSIMALIKQFALVSGRWLRVVGTEITLLPRESSAGDVVLPSLGLAREKDRQEEFASPSGEIDVQVVDRRDRESWGLDYGLGKVSALTWWYITRFAGVRTETEATWPAAIMPAELQLLSGTEFGQVVELDRSTDGQWIRLKMMQEAL